MTVVSYGLNCFTAAIEKNMSPKMASHRALLAAPGWKKNKKTENNFNHAPLAVPAAVSTFVWPLAAFCVDLSVPGTHNNC